MNHRLLPANNQFLKTAPLQIFKNICLAMLHDRNSVKTSLVLVLISAALLSPLTHAGGIKSVLKELSRAEKKLKDEGILRDNEDLYLSFKNGIEIHDTWNDGATVYEFDGYKILIKDKDRERLAELSQKDAKKNVLENTKKIEPYIKFYKSKPLKLEQMYASGSCFQRQNLDALELIKAYAELLISALDSSDIYDARGSSLEALVANGIKRISLATLTFNPEHDIADFEALWKSLDEKRPAIRKRIGNNPSLSKCYKLFKI